MSITNDRSESVSSGRELVSSRLFDTSPEALFRAFTDPDRLARWWGPEGFTNTFHEFDPRPGGTWRFVMQAPDGTSYHNLSEFIELRPPERIVLQHIEPVHRFRMTITFSEESEKTRLTWRMLFDEIEEAEKVREAVLAANEQNFDRLQAQLAALA